MLYIVNEDFAFLLNRLPMARAARDAGFEVHVATNVNKGADAIEAEGFVLHPIPFRRGGLSPLAAIPTLLAIRRVEKEIKPDVLHHSGLQCCVYGSVAALDKRFPIVNAITGLGYIFTSVNWRTRLLRQGMVWLLPWLLNRKSSCVLVQNPDDRATLLTLGIKPDRLTLIPGSGVDTDALKPLPEPEGPITFGFAGRLLVDKGIRALVAAHSILRARIRVQSGHRGQPRPCQSTPFRRRGRAVDRRPGTLVRHIDDIISLWQRCHCVLPPHREGPPVSLLEAAACGGPLVATDAPGCREIVLEDKTGLLVPIENPTALAQAIMRLAQSPELRARYGKAARQLVVDRLSARIIGSSVVGLYGELTRWRQGADFGETRRPGKIMLISQHYAPFPSTTSGYMTEIAEELARDGVVIVITSAPGSASNPADTGRPRDRNQSGGLEVSAGLRSFAAVLFSIQVFRRLKYARPEDALLSVTTPFTLPYTVTFAARLRKAASALIIYDLYPDTLVMAGFLRANSILTRWLRSANKTMFRWLDAMVIIGRDMAPKLLAYPKVSPSKISLIPNWATMPVRYRELASENSYRTLCGGRFVVADRQQVGPSP